MNTRTPLVAAALALALLATACGGSSGASESKVASLEPSVGDSSETTTTTSGADFQDALLKMTQCLRDHGLDVQDPTFDANGRPTGGGFFGPNSGVDRNSDEFNTAMDACRSIMQGVVPPGGGGGFLDRQAVQDAMNDFTACLRDQGLDVNDITFGDRGGTGPDTSNGNTATSNGNATDSNDGSQGPPDSGGFGPRGGNGNGQRGEGFDPTARIIDRLGLDPNDPTVKTAISACQSILTKAFQPPTSTTSA